MGAAREADQADFDLERFIDMFDEALTSRDPRVIDALRGLMMIVTLTRPESRDSGLHDRNGGPLRRLFEDMRHINSRLGRVEEELRQRDHFRHEQETARKYAYDYKRQQDDWSMQAATALSNKIDQDLLNTLKIKNVANVKGLLDK